MKLNSIHIEGLRGVQNNLTIPLQGKSALFYGDNGTGKSTISDVLEWFFYDRIEHLSDGEIGAKGHNAIRNIMLPDNKPGKLNLKITKLKDELIKTIELKNGKLISRTSNDNDALKRYMAISGNENLILRYKDLNGFACATKTERLEKLSSIIGYSQITNIRSVLRTVSSALSKDIRTKSFDNQINHQQGQIIEQFGRNITSDDQFFEAVNKLIHPFNLNLKVSSLQEVNAALKEIRQPDDSKEINQEAFLDKLQEKIILIPANLDELENQYKNYKKHFDSIVSDTEKLKGLILEKLLSSGKEVLESKDYISKDCPLCLTEQDKVVLISSISQRLKQLETVKNEQKKLLELQKSLLEQNTQTIQILDLILDEKQIHEVENTEYKKKLDQLKSHLLKYKEVSKLNPMNGDKLSDGEDLLINRADILSIQNLSKTALLEIRERRKSNPKLEAYNQIKIAGSAYATIRRIKQEKESYESQLYTMETIYSEFRKQQKSSLEAFLGAFSGRIDSIYQFLNPNEKIRNIKLAPIEEDEELSGITIELDILDKTGISPPHKYLSESHLNCLGIAFFLASAEAFNKQNKFIILDDIISSFDANHRKRFADLLIEQYGAYQLILLTHESSWFELVRNRIKGKDWMINTIKYSESVGTYIDDPTKNLKDKIEGKIQSGDLDNLGTDARKYLEQILKEIACDLDVKVSFRFNDVNEDRMSYELLTEIKATLGKRKCKELLGNPIIDRLLGSTFIGNKDSHDGAYTPDLADMKAFWQDIKDFEALLLCKECNTYVSQKYYDNVGKKIRCKNAEVIYSWEK